MPLNKSSNNSAIHKLDLNHRSKNKQSGVSLIEILITVFILGVGLLGVAALQINSISSNQEGFFTSQATSIAEDYSSRIRSSKLTTLMPTSTVDFDVFLANYHNGDSEAFTCGNTITPMCRSHDSTAASDCDLTEMATFDKWEICSLAKNTLPAGEVRAINNNRHLTLVIDWDSAEGRNDVGSKTLVNQKCTKFTGDTKRNCIIMEMVP